MLCSGAGKHRSQCCDSGKMEAASIQLSRIAKKPLYSRNTMKSANSNTLNFMELNKFTDDNFLTFSRILISIFNPRLLDLMGLKN